MHRQERHQVHGNFTNESTIDSSTREMVCGISSSRIGTSNDDATMHSQSCGEQPNTSGVSPVEGSHPAGNPSTAAAMIFPLAVAWAYLDAIAKTWLALGEKLHITIYGKSTENAHTIGRASKRSSSSRNTPGQQHATAAIPRQEYREGNVYPHRSRAHHHQQPNRLEFTLGDFLRSKIPQQNEPFEDHLSVLAPHTAEAAAQSSTAGCNDVCLPAQDRKAPAYGDDVRTTTTNATALRPRCFCLGSRRPKGLPVSTRPRKTDKTLVLDLDETLIHARKDLTRGGERETGRFDFMVVLSPKTKALSVNVGCCAHHGGGQEGPTSSTTSTAVRDTIEQARFRSRAVGDVLAETARSVPRSGGVIERRGSQIGRKVYVSKRPHLKEFLQAVSKEFEVVVFTAARAEFARAVLDEIDPFRKMVDHVLTRESCTRLVLSRRKQAAVVKDLGVIGRPLSKVCCFPKVGCGM